MKFYYISHPRKWAETTVFYVGVRQTKMCELFIDQNRNEASVRIALYLKCGNHNYVFYVRCREYKMCELFTNQNRREAWVLIVHFAAIRTRSWIYFVNCWIYNFHFSFSMWFLSLYFGKTDNFWQGCCSLNFYCDRNGTYDHMCVHSFVIVSQPQWIKCEIFIYQNRLEAWTWIALSQKCVNNTIIFMWDFASTNCVNCSSIKTCVELEHESHLPRRAETTLLFLCWISRLQNV